MALKGIFYVVIDPKHNFIHITFMNKLSNKYLLGLA